MKLGLSIYNEQVMQAELDRIASNPDATPEEIEKATDAFIEAHTNTEAAIADTVPFITHLYDFIDRCQKEKRRISERQQQAEAIAEKIENSILRYLDAKGMKAVEAGTFKIGTRRSTRVEVDVQEILPPEFIVVKTETSVDKKKIKEAINMGLDVPGARLVESVSLQIK